MKGYWYFFLAAILCAIFSKQIDNFVEKAIKDKSKENAGMKKIHIARLLLIIAALAIGGGLGYMLLVGFEPIKITVFVVSIVILGNVFYQIDKKIRNK